MQAANQGGVTVRSVSAHHNAYFDVAWGKATKKGLAPLQDGLSFLQRGLRADKGKGLTLVTREGRVMDISSI